MTVRFKTLPLFLNYVLVIFPYSRKNHFPEPISMVTSTEEIECTRDTYTGRLNYFSKLSIEAIDIVAQMQSSGGVLLKVAFLRISQNLQENTSVRLFF